LKSTPLGKYLDSILNNQFYANDPNVLSVCLRLNTIDCFEMTYFEIKKIGSHSDRIPSNLIRKIDDFHLAMLVSLGSGCSGSVLESS
jgi:hypothetical protein